MPIKFGENAKKILCSRQIYKLLINVSRVNVYYRATCLTPIIRLKKSVEKMNTQMTCEFIIISQLLGGQF